MPGKGEHALACGCVEELRGQFEARSREEKSHWRRSLQWLLLCFVFAKSPSSGSADVSYYFAASRVVRSSLLAGLTMPSK
jgi:hypothetical protein